MGDILAARQFVEKFGNEIAALVDVQIAELETVDSAVAGNVDAFRKGFVQYIPGGGGQYGIPLICKTKEEFLDAEREIERKLKAAGGTKKQKTLGEFG